MEKSMQLLQRLLAVFLVFSCHGVLANKPNIIILFADDLGYGDLPAYGHPTSVTPNLDRLFESGVKLTQFYSTSPVCSPSRSSLLTGKYPVRTGIWPGVLSPASVGGLQANITTISKLLKSSGYSTAHVGKWHLGIGENNQYLPHNHGFDYYYGIPISHDGCPCITCFYPHQNCLMECNKRLVPCPVLQVRNSAVNIVQQPVNLTTLNQQYTEEVVQFVTEQVAEKQAFFLYYAFQHTHIPQFAGKHFRNSTYRGNFGDSLAEIDWSIGQLLKAAESVLNNTIILFSSDNGANLNTQGGNSGALKCGKGTTYEGGMRVPAVFSWRGRITPGRRSLELASTLDVLPTMMKLAGIALPPNMILDGFDLSAMLLDPSKKSPRDFYIYYPTNPNPSNGLYAVRYQQYKAHYITQGSGLSAGPHIDKNCSDTTIIRHNPPLLYHLGEDPSEAYNINSQPGSAQILAKIEQIKKAHEAGMVWAPSEMDKGENPSFEPCCQPGCQPFPSCCTCRSHSKSCSSNSINNEINLLE